MLPNTMIYAMLILIVALNMCKNNQENDSSTTLLYIILIGGIIFTLSNNNNNLINNTGNVMENLQTGDNTNSEEVVNEYINDNDVNNEQNAVPNVNVNNVELQDEKITLTADDLLPANSEPVFNHPVTPSTEVTEQFLDAGGIIGMMSQTLRNPNYDLRCAPANPKVDVGPWMQSTIDPDITRKPLEDESCGGCNKS